MLYTMKSTAHDIGGYTTDTRTDGQMDRQTNIIMDRHNTYEPRTVTLGAHYCHLEHNVFKPWVFD